MAKMMKHLGDRYKVLSGWETARIIQKTLEDEGSPLTDRQFSKLRESFGDSGIRGNLDMPFIAYSWDEEKKSGKFWWRLTAPFFYLYYLIFILIILPIKWVFTGYYSISRDDKVGQFSLNWYNKIYDRHW